MVPILVIQVLEERPSEDCRNAQKHSQEYRNDDGLPIEGAPYTGILHAGRNDLGANKEAEAKDLAADPRRHRAAQGHGGRDGTAERRARADGPKRRARPLGDQRRDGHRGGKPRVYGVTEETSQQVADSARNRGGTGVERVPRDARARDGRGQTAGEKDGEAAKALPSSHGGPPREGGCRHRGRKRE